MQRAVETQTRSCVSDSRKPCSLRSTAVTPLIIGHRHCRHNVEQIFAASSAFAALRRDGSLLQVAHGLKVLKTYFGVIASWKGSVVAWGEAKNGGDCSFLALKVLELFIPCWHGNSSCQNILTIMQH